MFNFIQWFPESFFFDESDLNDQMGKLDEFYKYQNILRKIHEENGSIQKKILKVN